MIRQNRPTRRAFLRAVMTTPAIVALAACVPPQVEPETAPAPPAPSPEEATAAPAESTLPTDAPAQAALLEPTPACGDDDDEPTLAQTEGPYYTPDTPQRTSFLEPGISGTSMVVTGSVLTTDCRPVAAALLDFWHCDDAGVYDNQGYKLRGHFFADDQGNYRLETIMPGIYPGRTRHFHVKVQAPNQPVLTTQLYFPNEAQNERDGIYRPELLMDVQDTSEGKIGRFDFVLNVA